MTFLPALGVFLMFVWPSRVGGGPLWWREVAGAEAEDTGDGTPLHHACANGGEWLAHRYLAAGAHIDGRSLKGETPLLAACREGHEATRIRASASASMRASWYWHGQTSCSPAASESYPSAAWSEV